MTIAPANTSGRSGARRLLYYPGRVASCASVRASGPWACDQGRHSGKGNGLRNDRTRYGRTFRRCIRTPNTPMLTSSFDRCPLGTNGFFSCPILTVRPSGNFGMSTARLALRFPDYLGAAWPARPGQFRSSCSRRTLEHRGAAVVLPAPVAALKELGVRS